MLQIESWLQPISETEPCGPNLEGDELYVSLGTALKGSAERQVGKSVIAATPPDWKLVRDLAIKLLARTHDLQVAVHLARAELNCEGFPGYAQVLTVLHHWCENFWGTLHPQLDPTDNNDPTARRNMLLELISGDFLNEMRRVPLASSRGVRVSLREIALAKKEQPPRENEKPLSQSEIDGAFKNVPESELREVHEALASSLTHLAGLDKAFSSQAGTDKAVNFADLNGLLTKAFQLVDEQLNARIAALPADKSAAGAAAAPPKGLSGEVCSREDVVKALDKICEYYEKHEPSSPIPLLLRRAQRLCPMNFLEIVKELAPGGLPQAQGVVGTPPPS
jgi:type VI secretion system protein ImpA